MVIQSSWIRVLCGFADSALMRLNSEAVWFGLGAHGQRRQTATTLCRPQSIFMQHKLSQQTVPSSHLVPSDCRSTLDPKSTMWLYPTDSVVQLRIAARIGTHLWTPTMHWYSAGFYSTVVDRSRIEHNLRRSKTY